MSKRLTVSIGDQKINTLKIGVDHIVHGIAASATNTNNGDAGTKLLHCLRNGKVDCHD
jgi:hypothetical protein